MIQKCSAGMHTQTQRKLSLESDAFAAQNPAKQDSYSVGRMHFAFNSQGRGAAGTNEGPYALAFTPPLAGVLGFVN